MVFPWFPERGGKLGKDLGREEINQDGFVVLFCNEVLHVLRNTPKNRANLAEGSVGDDRRGNHTKGVQSSENRGVHLTDRCFLSICKDFVEVSQNVPNQSLPNDAATLQTSFVGRDQG